MIVKDDNTLQQALNLISLAPVYYSDENRFERVEDSTRLLDLMTTALDRGSIAIVSNDKGHMENWNYEIKLVRKQRYIDEKKHIRTWVREHPDVVKKYFERKKK